MDSCAGIGDDVDEDNSILFNVVAPNAPSAPTTFVSAAKSVPILFQLAQVKEHRLLAMAELREKRCKDVLAPSNSSMHVFCISETKEIFYRKKESECKYFLLHINY